ncbi:MAG: response regulator [Synechococcaceae cyanobacterium SM2_3_1]|nr:response regulator [Synechococcaceae cyanobacterium SM2_3_1]
MKILLVEDDVSLATLVKDSLEEDTYAVDLAENAQEAQDLMEVYPYDLVLLDVELPKWDGIQFCSRLRQQGYRVPILLLTARQETADKVAGLDAGADDYMVKPFEIEELRARIRSLLRRGGGATQPVLSWGDLLLDPSSCEISFEDQLVHATPKEYALLELLLRNPKRVYSQGEILDHLWAYEDSPGLDTVRAHVKGLRRKLKEVGAPDLIKTVYGLGYALKTPPEEEALPQVVSPQEQASRRTETLAVVARAWDRFKEKHMQRLQVLEEAVTLAQAQQLQPDLLETAQQEAHKLAGSLGTFGFQEGSHLASQIETLWQQPLSSEGVTQLATLIKRLHRTIEQPVQLGLPVVSTPSSFTAEAKVLVVDDDPTILSALEMLLPPWGLQVCPLANAEHFWSTLTQVTPDLIIMDVELPQQSGIELCQQVREADQWSWIPILFLTAHTDADTLHQVFSAGGDDFVTKPIVGPELVTRLFNRLERTRLLQRAAAKHLS